jgi:hypothetical protein
MLISLSSAQGSVTEKLAANSSKIETVRKEIKTGSFLTHKDCFGGCKNCKGCGKCKSCGRN